MARGVAIKRNFIPATDSKKPEEIDQLSTVDKGKDFVKAGEQA